MIVTAHEVMFRNVDEALYFAYRPATGKPQQSVLNKFMGASPQRHAEGLTMQERSAQAGMLLGMFGRLGFLHEAILRARYAPSRIPCSCGKRCCSGATDSDDWIGATLTISMLAGQSIDANLSNGLLRLAVVRDLFGNENHKASADDIAARCAVCEKTAMEYRRHIRDWLFGRKPKPDKPGSTGELTRAVDEAASLIYQAGLIEEY